MQLLQQVLDGAALKVTKETFQEENNASKIASLAETVSVDFKARRSSLCESEKM